MVRDLRPKRPSAINGQESQAGFRASEFGLAGELWKPLVISAVAHAVAFAGLVFVAPQLTSQRLILPPAQMVQLVDLPRGGGPSGSRSARDTPQPVAKPPEPPPEPPKPEPPKAEKPPAAKSVAKPEKPPPPKPKTPEPEMTLPTPKAQKPPKKEPPKREEKKPEPPERQVAEKKKGPESPAPRPETNARQPPSTAAAPAVRPGTGAGAGTGPGGGLALGTGGGMLSLDTANFPFTYYLRQVTGRIEENWVRPSGNLGRVIVYFRIRRDGSIVEPQVYESSRNQAVDMLAAAAVKRAEPFPPLPVEFGGDYLGIYLCFGMGALCPGQKEG